MNKLNLNMIMNMNMNRIADAFISPLFNADHVRRWLTLDYARSFKVSAPPERLGHFPKWLLQCC